MGKYHKIGWFSVFFIGGCLLLTSHAFAGVVHSSAEGKDCQTALEKFSLRLEKLSRERPQQAYYASLYRQTQDLLARPSLDKCQNFFIVTRDIVGNHDADLGQMPYYSAQQNGGALTKSILKTVPKRELRNVRYEYGERAKPPKEKKGMGEEEEDLEELKFAPSPINRSSKTGNHLPSEAKDYEPKF